MSDLPERRSLVIAVDDTEDSEKAFQWALKNLARPSDELHICHVVPRVQLTSYGFVPPVDFAPVYVRDPEAEQATVQKAEVFITQRFLNKLPSGTEDSVPARVHIIKSETDTDSVGHVLCNKAEEMNAVCMVMASHNKGKLAEMFMGSVTQFCIHHSKIPLAIVR